MRVIARRFQPVGDYIELIAAGDLHKGHPCYNPRKATAHQNYVLSNPDRFTVDLGDPVENNLKDSPGSGIFDQTERPRDQRRDVVAYYRPMKDRLLGVCESNHPERSVKAADFSPTEYICDVLDVPYIRYIAAFSITVGNSARGYTYNIAARHFAGGAATPEGILRQLRLKSQALHGFDVHLAGHCHFYTHEAMPARVLDARHSKMREMEVNYATCSSFMDWDASYAEGKSYDPPLFGMVSIKLYRDERRVEVERLVY